jgi:hypothetical protein
VAEFVNNAWCWLSNMWRSVPGKLRHIFDNQHQALLTNSATYFITNTKRC